jgi:Arc/MetJ-type ribon-helix-helix transcriptional regulator
MADSEKITINMSVVDLGKVDLLVSEGFYANRTDFIRTAIRNQLMRHDDDVKETCVRRSLTLGVNIFTRNGLEELNVRGEKISALIVGQLIIQDDVSPELAQATIESVRVYGSFKANKAVKAAIADRIR